MRHTPVLLIALVGLACVSPHSRDEVVPQPSAVPADFRARGADEQIYYLAVAALAEEHTPDSLVLDAVDAPSPPVFAQTTFGGSPILESWSPAQRDQAREALDAIEGATPDLDLTRRALEERGIRVLDGAAVPPPSLDDAGAAFETNAVPRLRLYGIGFSADSSTAAVFAWTWCGPLCGTRIVILVNRTPTGTWALLNQHLVWVS